MTFKKYYSGENFYIKKPITNELFFKYKFCNF